MSHIKSILILGIVLLLFIGQALAGTVDFKGQYRGIS